MNNKTCWVKLNDNWHQKIYYSENMELVYTYHYNSKLQNATKVIVLKTHLAEQACSYKLIEKDLRDILILISECKRLCSIYDLSISPNNTPHEGIIVKGLLSAIAIHYIRCFSNGQGRKYKLQQNKIPKKHVAIHKLLKDMRDKYIAHTEKGIYEKCAQVFLIPPYKKFKRGKVGLATLNFELHQMMAAPWLLDTIQSLIEDIHKNISKKIEHLNNQTKNEISQIPEEKLYQFIKGRNGYRIELYQTDLNTLLRQISCDK